jgi:hypothetical protein
MGSFMVSVQPLAISKQQDQEKPQGTNQYGVETCAFDLWFSLFVLKAGG